MNRYLSRLICNDRTTTLLLSRITSVNINCIIDEMCQFYVQCSYDDREATKVPLSIMPEYNIMNKIIDVEWCSVTIDDLKVLRSMQSIGKIIKRDDYFTENDDMYIIRPYHDQIMINFYEVEDEIRLVYNEDDGFIIVYIVPYTRRLYHRYQSNNEGSWKMLD